MTDLLDMDLDPEGPDPDDGPEMGPGARCAKTTKAGRCPNVLGPEAHRLQRYCVAHQPQKGKKKGPRPERAEPLPPTITVDLGGKAPSKKEADLAAKVEEGAQVLLGLLPLFFAAVGDGVCTEALSAQIPAISHQLGELSKFHPGIAKVFVGADVMGEAGTWIALAIATLPAIVAILVHHKVVKGAVAERLEGVVATMKGMSGGAA